MLPRRFQVLGVDYKIVEVTEPLADEWGNPSYSQVSASDRVLFVWAGVPAEDRDAAIAAGVSRAWSLAVADPSSLPLRRAQAD